MGALLWWHREEEQLEGDMRYESLGPVLNPDGSPSDITKKMLEGTGRSLVPPFGPVTVITAEGTGQGMLYVDDHIEMITAEEGRLEGEYHGKDTHLEAQYEDRYLDPEC